LEVNKIYDYNKNIFNKLKKKLPYFIKTFPTNKLEIYNAIVSNKGNLKKIIRIIHPEIKKKMNIFLKKNNKQKFVILDIPLLIENKLNKPEDVIIYVGAKKNIIQKYLKKRAGYNQKIVEILKEMQTLPERKKELSDIVLENNFNPKKMRLRARQVLDSIII
jgi:dephospho-CoA kinase